MSWVKNFPYKWQVAEIALGILSLSCGAIFLLISVGVTSQLWIIMAGTSFGVGVLCTLTGAIWCCWAIRTSGSDYDIYGRVNDFEATTMTSETTEVIR
jgi:hypothetical protein